MCVCVCVCLYLCVCANVSMCPFADNHFFDHLYVCVCVCVCVYACVSECLLVKKIYSREKNE